MSSPERTAYQTGSDPLAGHPDPDRRAYAHWGKRVGAAVVDALTLVPFAVLGVVVVPGCQQSPTAPIGYQDNGTPGPRGLSSR
jgi:hypothetical protein